MFLTLSLSLALRLCDGKVKQYTCEQTRSLRRACSTSDVRVQWQFLHTLQKGVYIKISLSVVAAAAASSAAAPLACSFTSISHLWCARTPTFYAPDELVLTIIMYIYEHMHVHIFLALLTTKNKMSLSMGQGVFFLRAKRWAKTQKNAEKTIFRLIFPRL